MAENTDIVLNGFKALGIFLASQAGLAVFTTFAGVIANIAGSFGQLLTLNFAGFASTLGALAGAFVSIGGAGAGVVAGLAAFRETFIDSDSASVRRLGLLLDNIVNRVQDLIDTTLPDLNIFGDDLDTTIDRLADFATEATLRTIGFFDDLVNRFGIMVDRVELLFRGTGLEAIIDGLIVGVSIGADLLVNGIQTVGSIVSGIGTAISTVADGIRSFTIDPLTQAFTALKDTVLGFVQYLANLFPGSAQASEIIDNLRGGGATATPNITSGPSNRGGLANVDNRNFLFRASDATEAALGTAIQAFNRYSGLEAASLALTRNFPRSTGVISDALTGGIPGVTPFLESQAENIPFGFLLPTGELADVLGGGVAGAAARQPGVLARTIREGGDAGGTTSGLPRPDGGGGPQISDVIATRTAQQVERARDPSRFTPFRSRAETGTGLQFLGENASIALGYPGEAFNFFRRQAADLITNVAPERAFSGGLINRTANRVRGQTNLEFFNPTAPQIRRGTGDTFNIGGLSGIRGLTREDLNEIFFFGGETGRIPDAIDPTSIDPNSLARLREVALDRDPSRVGLANALILGRARNAVDTGSIAETLTPDFANNLFGIVTQGSRISSARRNILRNVAETGSLDPNITTSAQQILDASTGRRGLVNRNALPPELDLTPDVQPGFADDLTSALGSQFNVASTQAIFNQLGGALETYQSLGRTGINAASIAAAARSFGPAVALQAAQVAGRPILNELGRRNTRTNLDRLAEARAAEGLLPPGATGEINFGESLFAGAIRGSPDEVARELAERTGLRGRRFFSDEPFRTEGGLTRDEAFSQAFEGLDAGFGPLFERLNRQAAEGRAGATADRRIRQVGDQLQEILDPTRSPESLTALPEQLQNNQGLLRFVQDLIDLGVEPGTINADLRRLAQLNIRQTNRAQRTGGNIIDIDQGPTLSRADVFNRLDNIPSEQRGTLVDEIAEELGVNLTTFQRSAVVNRPSRLDSRLSESQFDTLRDALSRRGVLGVGAGAAVGGTALFAGGGGTAQADEALLTESVITGEVTPEAAREANPGVFARTFPITARALEFTEGSLITGRSTAEIRSSIQRRQARIDSGGLEQELRDELAASEARQNFIRRAGVGTVEDIAFGDQAGGGFGVRIPGATRPLIRAERSISDRLQASVRSLARDIEDSFDDVAINFSGLNLGPEGQTRTDFTPEQLLGDDLEAYRQSFGDLIINTNDLASEYDLLREDTINFSRMAYEPVLTSIDNTVTAYDVLAEDTLTFASRAYNPLTVSTEYTATAFDLLSNDTLDFAALAYDPVSNAAADLAASMRSAAIDFNNLTTSIYASFQLRLDRINFSPVELRQRAISSQIREGAEPLGIDPGLVEGLVSRATTREAEVSAAEEAFRLNRRSGGGGGGGRRGSSRPARDPIADLRERLNNNFARQNREAGDRRNLLGITDPDVARREGQLADIREQFISAGQSPDQARESALGFTEELNSIDAFNDALDDTNRRIELVNNTFNALGGILNNNVSSAISNIAQNWRRTGDGAIDIAHEIGQVFHDTFDDIAERALQVFGENVIEAGVGALAQVGTNIITGGSSGILSGVGSAIASAFGFQNGGSIIYGGPGREGVDRVPLIAGLGRNAQVLGRVSPGETIDIRPQGRAANNNAPIVQNININVSNNGGNNPQRLVRRINNDFTRVARAELSNQAYRR